jgi:hypothetical protein
MNLYVTLNVKIPIELHKSIFFGLNCKYLSPFIPIIFKLGESDAERRF